MWGTPLLGALATQFGQDVERVSQTLQVAAAPVFMLTAVTSFLLVLTNRLHYFAERQLRLDQEMTDCEARSDRDADAAALLTRLLRFRPILRRRVTLTRNAMVAAGGSGLLIALDVGILFYGALSGQRVGLIVGALFLIAMVSFQLSLLFFLRDLLSKHCISDLGMLKSRSQPLS